MRQRATGPEIALLSPLVITLGTSWERHRRALITALDKAAGVSPEALFEAVDALAHWLSRSRREGEIFDVIAALALPQAMASGDHAWARRMAGRAAEAALQGMTNDEGVRERSKTLVDEIVRTSYADPEAPVLERVAVQRCAALLWENQEHHDRARQIYASWLSADDAPMGLRSQAWADMAQIEAGIGESNPQREVEAGQCLERARECAALESDSTLRAWASGYTGVISAHQLSRQGAFESARREMSAALRSVVAGCGGLEGSDGTRWPGDRRAWCASMARSGALIVAQGHDGAPASWNEAMDWLDTIAWPCVRTAGSGIGIAETARTEAAMHELEGGGGAHRALAVLGRERETVHACGDDIGVAVLESAIAAREMLAGDARQAATRYRVQVRPRTEGVHGGRWTLWCCNEIARQAPHTHSMTQWMERETMAAARQCTDHTQRGWTMHCVASSQEQAGAWDKAARTRMEECDCYTAPDKAPALLETQVQVARALRKGGDLNRALVWGAQAESTAQTMKPENAPRSQAWVQIEQGRTFEALGAFEEAARRIAMGCEILTTQSKRDAELESWLSHEHQRLKARARREAQRRTEEEAGTDGAHSADGGVDG